MLGVKKQRKKASMAPDSFFVPFWKNSETRGASLLNCASQKKLVNILTFSSASLDGPLLLTCSCQHWIHQNYKTVRNVLGQFLVVQDGSLGFAALVTLYQNFANFHTRL